MKLGPGKIPTCIIHMMCNNLYDNPVRTNVSTFSYRKIIMLMFRELAFLVLFMIQTNEVHGSIVLTRGTLIRSSIVDSS